MIERDDAQRVVITGMGAITPIGEGVEAFWDGLLAGRSGAAPMLLADTDGYATKISAEVKDWNPERYIERREARRMARFAQFAVAAARLAMQDASLAPESVEPERTGVLLGNGNGGYSNIEESMRTLIARGGMKIDPLFMPKALPNMAAAQIALQLDLKGYNGTISTACAAATHAIGEAAEIIRAGRADLMLTGGAEAGICTLGLAAFAVMRAMTSRNDEPARASRPFDKDRDGFLPAEGAAVFVIESLARARARGAHIYAEIAGFGVTADAHHIVAPQPGGEGAARAIRQAMQSAGIAPETIDYVNAHGTSTPQNDSCETAALKAALGEHAYSVPISSTKSMIGHALGASGALETVAAVKSIETGLIHPTINYETPDPECDLDYVPNTVRRVEVRTVLKNSFGFGGQNACLVLRKVE